MIYQYILSERQKQKLKEAIGICEMCGSSSNIVIHRIRRANQGGEYTLRNLMVICEDCHKQIHSREFK